MSDKLLVKTMNQTAKKRQQSNSMDGLSKGKDKEPQKKSQRKSIARNENEKGSVTHYPGGYHISNTPT